MALPPLAKALNNFVDGDNRTAIQSTNSASSPANASLLFFGPGGVPFRHIQVLGQGGFAVVDKVEVTCNGAGANLPRECRVFPSQIYARKIINISRHQNVESVMKEVEALKKLRHQHTVELQEYLEMREHGADRGDWDEPKFDRMQSLRSRSQANKERLQNEITLLFNAVAQYDSRVSVHIGQAAQSDSAAIKAIATLTLTFLPATFVCAVFSMSFLNFSPGSDGQPGKWSVSGKVWIYWAVAVPVTGITLAAWFLWRHYFPVKAIGS